jgi:hypothetical protein
VLRFLVLCSTHEKAEDHFLQSLTLEPNQEKGLLAYAEFLESVRRLVRHSRTRTFVFDFSPTVNGCCHLSKPRAAGATVFDSPGTADAANTGRFAKLAADRPDNKGLSSIA